MDVCYTVAEFTIFTTIIITETEGDNYMSRKRKEKLRNTAEDEKSKERKDGQEGEEIEWPQFPYTAEELARAVVTPIKSEEAKKRLGISD